MIPIQHIHPMLIHFPIVFIVCLAAFDTVAVFAGYPVTGRTITGNISTTIAALAGAAAVVAMMFGDMALEFAEAKGFSSEIAEIHEGLGQATAISLAIWAVIRIFLWWRDRQIAGGVAYIFPLVSILGLIVVTATAFYGGQLVFDLGVNVPQG